MPALVGLTRSSLLIDPSDGLNESEVAALAVLRAPELRIARANAKVAQAQAFAAGLMAEPQLSASRDYTRASTPDVTSAFALGIAQDISALVTAPIRHKMRTALERQSELDLLWQELQVMARARQLFNQTMVLQQMVALLREQQQTASERARSLGVALQAGWVSAATAGTGFATQATIESLLAEALRQQTDASLNLHALIGLRSDVPLNLRPAAQPTHFAPSSVNAAKQGLSERRADLLALRAGYAAQEAHLRIAAINQFPPLTLSLSNARDTGGIRTRGYGASLGLPIFGSGRAAVAAELASRERLHAEYAARLTTTMNEIDLAAQSLQLLEERIPALDRAVTQLASTAQNAALAMSSRDIDQLAYADLVDAYVGKRIELLTARQTRVDLQTSLVALLAVDPAVLTATSGVNSQ